MFELDQSLAHIGDENSNNSSITNPNATAPSSSSFSSSPSLAARRETLLNLMKSKRNLNSNFTSCNQSAVSSSAFNSSKRGKSMSDGSRRSVRTGTVRDNASSVHTGLAGNDEDDDEDDDEEDQDDKNDANNQKTRGKGWSRLAARIQLGGFAAQYDAAV